MFSAHPITYLYSDVADEPLTLSHLVIGQRFASLPYSDHFSDSEGTDAAIQRRAKYLHQLLQCSLLAEMVQRVPRGLARVPQLCG